MRRATVRAIVATLVLAGGVTAASAQETRVPTPPDGRGLEGGAEVLSSRRSGEFAAYFGYFQEDHMAAFRFGARDETDAIPCSAGVMYEYTHRRTAGRFFMPTAGVSFSRIFDCATDEQVIARPSPPAHGAIALSGGVRLGIFTGLRAAGSLKVMYFVERLQGHDPASDRTNRGINVGIVVHGR